MTGVTGVTGLSDWCDWMAGLSDWCDWCDWMAGLSDWCDWMAGLSDWCDWYMRLLRSIRQLNANKNILEKVYRSLTESVVTFDFVSWFGNNLASDRARLVQVVGLQGRKAPSQNRFQRA